MPFTTKTEEMAACAVLGSFAGAPDSNHPQMNDKCKRKTNRAWSFLLRGILVLGAVTVLVTVLMMLSFMFATPQTAEAWPWSDIPFIGPVLDWTIGGEDPLSKLLAAPLREMLNALLAMQINMLSWFSTDSLLVGAFDKMFNGVSPGLGKAIFDMVSTVHHVAVMPFAYVILLVCLCYRTSRILYDMNSHDTGIDLFKLIIMFVVFFFVKAVVDNSWELMIAIYELCTQVTKAVPVTNYVPEAADGKFSEDFSNVGMLLFMVIPLLLGFITIWACTMIAKVSLIARIATIYLYAAFSPIPIASAVTDNGRQTAFTFGKKFAAHILAGAIMLVFFNMLSLCMQSMTTVYIQISQATDAQGMIDAMGGYMMSFLVLITFTMLIGKSGKFSQDILGVG